MTGLPSEVNVAVIGAGAAGIATRRLVEAGGASLVALEGATAPLRRRLPPR